MGCMKCGRDMEEGQVFCASCLEIMRKYPVKPGTVVTIPTRHNDAPARKTPRKRTISPEEQVKKLRKRCRILGFFLALFIAAACVLGWFTVDLLMKDDEFLPGQNYSALETTVPENT